MLAALYLCCFLDKTNVGNAKILGLTEDLGINPHQYGVALAVFYIPYILCEIPSSLVLKKVSPRIWLAFLGSACGIIGMCISFVQNYAGFVAIRLVLGLFEGGKSPSSFAPVCRVLRLATYLWRSFLGILPAIIVYFSGLYTRGEIALRVGVFYTSTSLSGTFSGLLARGLSAIGPHYPFDAGWRWIMFIEGPLTIMVAVSVCLIIPNNVGSAKFLTPEERDFALQRLHDDVPRWLAADGSPLESEKFQWSEVRRGFRSIQAWLTASAYLCILSGIYSYGIFSPAIIKGLGYTANDAQLWSVIPYAVASVVTVISAVYSDKYRLRGPFMLGTLAIGIIGYAVVGNLNDSQLHVKYGMMMLMATGLYASVPPMIVWLTNNSAGHYKLATCTGLQMSIANLAGFVSCESSIVYRCEPELTFSYSLHIPILSSSILFPVTHDHHGTPDLCMGCVSPLFFQGFFD